MLEIIGICFIANRKVVVLVSTRNF